MRISWDELGRVKEAETSFLKLKVGDEVFFYRSSGDELSRKKTKGKVVSLVSQHDIFAKENVVMKLFIRKDFLGLRMVKAFLFLKVLQ